MKKKTKLDKRNFRRRQYQIEMREVARDLGNCTHCFNFNDDRRYLLCSKCRIQARGYQKKKDGI